MLIMRTHAVSRVGAASRDSIIGSRPAPKRIWVGWLSITLLLCWPWPLTASPLTLAQTYAPSMAIEGYWMSEKLDGIRATWDGQTLRTRGGHPVVAPPGFTAGWPAFPLDGELWTQRDDYQNVARIVLDQTPSADWAHVTYNVFDSPLPGLTFAERHAKVQAWFAAHPAPQVRIVEQRACPSREALDDFLRTVEAAGGEGVMLRDPNAPFEPGRSSTLLKVKSHQDAEATVIGYRAGKGKYNGKVGSLWVERDGTRFYIGSGLTDADRADPPPIGARITFRHNGYTEAGKPRFPRFLRLRRD
ncbi:MAG: DNA ligase [Thiotrichales bacterium]